jgi:hypothetical protein
MKTEAVKEKKLGQDWLPDLEGVWELRYQKKKPTNVFGGQTLGPYENPRNGKTIERRNADGKVMPYLFIESERTKFFPDNNIQHKLDIQWLIHNPEITVEYYDHVPDAYKAIKKPGPWRLVNLNFQDQRKIDEDDYIDKLVGRISFDSGTSALSLHNLRVILAELGKTYRDRRFVSNPVTERKALRKTLKNYVRADIENARQVNEMITEIDKYANSFILKEMKRLRIIAKNPNGIYKFRNIPLATGDIGILRHWDDEPQIKEEMMDALSKAQEEEQKEIERSTKK